jgi:YbbR domain-containing protein
VISFLRQYVFHNFGLKLLSLIIAVVLWLAVVRDPLAEVVLKVPIEFEHVPQNLDFTSEHVPQAEIRVRGPERTIRNLNQEDVHASLDLANATPGEHTYDLNVRGVRVPRSVEVVQVMPAQLRIDFDNNITRMVPVRPRVIGTFAPGVQLAPNGIISDPAEVSVVGPEKRVNQIEAVLTDPVDATGVIGRATFATSLYVPDPLVHLAHPGQIHVTVITEKSGRQASISHGQAARY